MTMGQAPFICVADFAAACDARCTVYFVAAERAMPSAGSLVLVTDEELQFHLCVVCYLLTRGALHAVALLTHELVLAAWVV